MKFEVVKLGEYLTLQKGISYTSSNLVDNSDSGLLTINAFTPGGGYKPNSEKPYEGNIDTNYLLSDGDVLVAMTEQDSGLLASPLVINRGKTSFANLTFSLDVGRFVKKQEGLEPRYIFNLLRIPAFRIRAAYGDSGSTVQRLPYEALYEQKVPKPTLEVQNAIINFIDKLDEKIFTNSSTSKTLEDIAQTIFKSWFIDFDPVKAKMNGEKPIGMDDETAALFPDSFEESELGLIPKGWEVRKISAFGRVVTGKTPSTKKQEFWGSEVPFVTIPDMHGHLMITKTNRALSILGANSQKSQNVPAGSTMVSCIATPGLVAFATKNCQTNQQINSVIPSSQSPSTWLFWHLRSLIPTLIINSGIGTIFANLNKSDFSNIESITAPLELRDAFSRLIGPQVQMITALNKESEQLRSIRDSLLPRLISGELQIPEEMLAS
jgi:type I restriction enzyme S subunit